MPEDRQLHIRNLKPLPPAHNIVDKCIECGFCEVVCPSRNLSLTPRQRIAVQREIARLKASCDNPTRLQALEWDYRYLGEQTCAADGLCAVSCPVEINTGEYTKYLRSLQVTAPVRKRLADWTAGNYHHTAAFLRTSLKLINLAHRHVGTSAMLALTRAARRLSGHRLPAWNPYMPQGIKMPRNLLAAADKSLKAVYFPSCINTVMGPAWGDPDQTPLYQIVVKVLDRAGFSVILPPRRDLYCCGVPFESKGYMRQADAKLRQLEELLLTASQNGRYPILCDTGPCVYRMRQTLNPRLEIYEPVEFIQHFLLDHLQVVPSPDTIAMHITCSSRKMGLEFQFRELAATLAAEAIFPDEVSCCGWAGDRGFNYPELTAAALAPLKPVLQGRCTTGYSNSRTCEIGLSQHSGIYYKSIFYVLEKCSRKQ